MQRTESGKGGRGRKVFQKKKKRGGKGKRKGRMLLSCVTFVCLSLLSHFLSGYCGCCCFSLCAFSLSHTHTFAFILDFVVYPVCVRLSVCLFVSFSLSLSLILTAPCVSFRPLLRGGGSPILSRRQTAAFDAVVVIGETHTSKKESERERHAESFSLPPSPSSSLPMVSSATVEASEKRDSTPEPVLR